MRAVSRGVATRWDGGDEDGIPSSAMEQTEARHGRAYHDVTFASRPDANQTRWPATKAQLVAHPAPIRWAVMRELSADRVGRVRQRFGLHSDALLRCGTVA